MSCPCHSGKSYDDCCGCFISHQAVAENAQQLMRSRYTAYVLNKPGYLLESWHADFRPVDLPLDQGIKWLGLEILQSSTQGNEAMVEFEALFLLEGQVVSQHERSQFVFQQGRWFYTTGEAMKPTREAWKPGRNAACPCGSGQKFKRCCGK